ncbi:MAG: DMT family transporter [Gammaproteobacteria bacterium]|nr:DMT family transporter [Gammaproteobacteria bacterium]
MTKHDTCTADPANLGITYLLLTLSAVFWGGTFIAGRQLASQIDPVSAAFLRFALATLLLWAWVGWRHRRLPGLTLRQGVAAILLGITGIVAYNLFFFEGLKSVEAGRAALIVAINPVVIALASHLLFHEPLGGRRAAGVALSLCGALVVIARGDLVDLLSGSVGLGEVLLLGCVASWSLYTLIGRRVLGRLSPLVTVAYASLAGTVMLGLLFGVRGGPGPGVLREPVVLAGIGYLAVFGTVLAFVWFYAGVKAIGATRAAQFINLVPVSGVLLGALVLHEPVTPAVLGGGIMVILGLWLTNRHVGRH